MASKGALGEPKVLPQLHRFTISNNPFEASHIHRTRNLTSCPDFRARPIPTSSVNLLGVRYFLENSCTQGDSFSFAILQHSFARRALFLYLIWFKPKPPQSLGKVTVCQLTRWNFLFSFVEPHKKFLISLSIALHILIGNA